jgi:hypothetical protein
MSANGNCCYQAFSMPIVKKACNYLVGERNCSLNISSETTLSGYLFIENFSLLHHAAMEL